MTTELQSVIAFNATRTTEYTVYYIPVDVAVILGMIAFFCLFMFVLCMSDFARMRRILDFYRLKYTFDRELESKDTTDQEKLNNREKRFKKRVFKD